jgi:hypothetical protein
MPGIFFVNKSCIAEESGRQNYLAISQSISAGLMGHGQDGAQERTRTFTAVKPLAPEASASTNSATWARAGY